MRINIQLNQLIYTYMENIFERDPIPSIFRMSDLRTHQDLGTELCNLSYIVTYFIN